MLSEKWLWHSTSTNRAQRKEKAEQVGVSWKNNGRELKWGQGLSQGQNGGYWAFEKYSPTFLWEEQEMSQHKDENELQMFKMPNVWNAKEKWFKMGLVKKVKEKSWESSGKGREWKADEREGQGPEAGSPPLFGGRQRKQKQWK